MNPQLKKLGLLSAVVALLYVLVYNGASSILSPYFAFAGGVTPFIVAFIFFFAVFWFARKVNLDG